jgi:hypothetical protein
VLTNLCSRTALPCFCKETSELLHLLQCCCYNSLLISLKDDAVYQQSMQCPMTAT